MLKKVMVIGGSGFLGSHIIDQLLIKKYKVYNYDVLESKQKNKSLNFIKGDVLDFKKLDKSLNGIDYIFHCGGISEIDYAINNKEKTLDVNVTGVRNICILSIKHKIKKVFFSSSVYVFNNYSSFYGASKKISEILIETYFENTKTTFVHLRYGSLFGERAQEWNGINKYINEIKNNRSLIFYGSGNEEREFIEVSDAAKISIDQINKKNSNYAITITGISKYKLKDIFSMIFEILGIKENIKYINSKKKQYHYSASPFMYKPLPSRKIVLDQYNDLGETIYKILSN